MPELYLALYAPSSVHKLLDFVKTAYAVDGVVPVIIRPIGAAAQVGVPEAYRVSYKLGKPLVVLPEISDLSHLLNCNRVYYISEDGEPLDFNLLIRQSKCNRIALVISSGEQEPSKKELEGAKIVWPSNVPQGMPSVALAGIVVYEIAKLGTEGCKVSI